MAACRPRPVPSHHQLLQQQQQQQQQISHLQLQQQDNAVLHQNLHQQSHYSPQILNWVYLAIEDQNQTPINQSADQVGAQFFFSRITVSYFQYLCILQKLIKATYSFQSKLLSDRWGSLPQSQSQANYLQPLQQHHQQQQQQSALSPASNGLSNNHYGGSITDSITDLAEYFRDLLIVQKKPPKRPPDDYMCHACFWAGHHYIRDCPKVLEISRRLFYCFSLSI